ncbi:ABC-2 transporter permease [Defluviitalea phaphyphila]|uniref:ABC-2 transporter permease n=1 Tax=Defluviitalea phaphyphila TaxID=1473580 RepID=UPI0007314673|nr:ABC-2 transporter permease [Defluviitalea phaphyphila]
MFNLILKDILIQKNTLRFGIVYILLMILSSRQFDMFLISVTVFSYIMIQVSSALDDKNKSDILLNSLPLNRKTVVGAKYLSTFIFAAMAIVYYILITGVIKIFKLPFKVYPVSFESVVGALFSIVLVTSIYFPIFFKIGYIRSRIINFILFFGGSTVAGILISKLIENKNKTFIQGILQFLNNQSNIQIVAEIFVIMILLLVISYVFSLKFYRKREF